MVGSQQLASKGLRANNKATGAGVSSHQESSWKQPDCFTSLSQNAMPFYGWAPRPDFWLLQCLVLLRFILRSSPSMKWISAFPGLNCPHQLKALPVMKIHPLFLSGKKDNNSAKSSLHFIEYQPCLFPRTSDVEHEGCSEAGGCWKGLKNQGPKGTSKAVVPAPQSAVF